MGIANKSLLVNNRNLFMIRSYSMSKLLLICLLTHLSSYSQVNSSNSKFISLVNIDSNYILSIPAIPNKLEVLVVSRVVSSTDGIPKTALRSSGYRGGLLSNNIIRFSTSSPDSIILERLNPKSWLGEEPYFSTYSKFPVISRNQSYEGSAKVLINQFLTNINEITFFSPQIQRALGVGNPKKIWVTKIISLSNYLEITSQITFDQNEILTISTSFTPLSGNKMRARMANDCINYFQQPLSKNVGGFSKSIKRWRLEPKPEDVNKYLNGQLVEPQKKIVFYIDTTVPRKLRSYFAQGVTDWADAFQKIGFRNAISADFVENNLVDTCFSIFSDNKSAIHYLQSTVPDATFSTIVDPRSGEIIQSHILWSSQMENVLKERYFVQVSQLDRSVRSFQFSDTLIGELIRRVIAHEVGHALGLDHNMFASFSTTVGELRIRKVVEKKGISPSIMDYAKFNYVAQEIDSITDLKGINWSIGEYDYWALNWGYKYFQDTVSVTYENSWLDKEIADKEKNKTFFYCSYKDDYRLIEESLGNDHAIASEYGLENLKYVLNNITTGKNGYQVDSNFFRPILFRIVEQYRFLLSHVTVDLGGKYAIKSPVGFVYKFLNKSTQQKSLMLILDEFIKEPQWLTNNKLINQFLNKDSLVQVIQETFFLRLLNNSKFDLFQDPVSKQMIDVITYEIWKNHSKKKSISKYEKLLQLNYLIPFKEMLLLYRSIKDTLKEHIIIDHLKHLARIIKIAKIQSSIQENIWHYDKMLYSINELIINRNN